MLFWSSAADLTSRLFVLVCSQMQRQIAQTGSVQAMSPATSPVSLRPQLKLKVQQKKVFQDITNTVKLASTQLVAREDEALSTIDNHTSSPEDETVSTIDKRINTHEGETNSTVDKHTCIQEDEIASTIDKRTNTRAGRFPPPEALSSYDATYESGLDDDDDDADSPGPFISIHEIRHDTTVRVVAVRDMDNGRALLRGRPMCIKIVPKSMDDMIARELRAYKALYRSSVDNWVPYVMRLEASLKEHDHLYFIMELMDCDLLNVLECWDLALRKIHRRQWVAQLTTGLVAIHAAGIIHRDLKPENIFVDFRFNVRIGDFGCSYTHPRGKAISRLGAYSYDLAGTWPYQAPEMLRNDDFPLDKKKKYSLQVDYWALGLIVFELEQNVDRPMCLFEDKNDLWNYINYRPSQYRGRSYFSSRGFSKKISPPARSLIMGLIRPAPELRFDHTRVRAHPYFLGPRGDMYNEFHGIEKRGKDLNSIPIGTDVPSERLKHCDSGDRDVFFPILLSPNEYIDVDHTWINPRGHWGTIWGNL